MNDQSKQGRTNWLAALAAWFALAAGVAYAAPYMSGAGGITSSGASTVYIQGGVMPFPTAVFQKTIPLTTAMSNTSYSVTATPVTTFFCVASGTKRTTSFDLLTEWNPSGVSINWKVVP